ncbi:hypothetical protein BOX15_Mlig031145g1, partial [Macrostomum lignano]
FYHGLVLDTVLHRQNPVTGLVATSEQQDHAYIRDNTYAAMCVWALALAYKKVAEADEDRARLKDLEGRAVKCMRSLLHCMMRQSDKLERFKTSRQPLDALHCKFSASDLGPVTGDGEYGHLQLDAVSLYLLALAQMTASGLVLIYTPEEVAFVQNLVFYLESAYTVSDYGIWERGDKTNHGLPELNSTSIGMAKAALEALAELDLFGSSGGTRSFVHVMADDPQSCAAVLESMLPRESCSKETDAGLLSVISYPAFAIDNEDVVNSTRDCIVSVLEGRYGCCRFLRDGYRTAVEDPTRLHYEPCELKQFENIECEWPLFFCYLLLDSLFHEDEDRSRRYAALLERLAQPDRHGRPLMPESYAVPADLVAEERANPGSQERHPVGALPHLWSQSVYTICLLLLDGFLRPQEIDPLGRRLALEAKPDLVVQVVVIAEDSKIQAALERHMGLRVQDFDEVQSDTGVCIFPAKLLGHFYSHLGQCQQLGLSGRQSSEAGVLATSRLYNVGSQMLAFTPQFLDHHSFYLSLDLDFLLDQFRTHVAYLRRTWAAVGRPLFIMPVYHWYFSPDQPVQPALYSTVKKLQSGYIHGTRVTLGMLSDFVDTSCVTSMNFLDHAKGDALLDQAKAASRSSRRGRSRLGSGSNSANAATPSASGAASRVTSPTPGAGSGAPDFAALARRKKSVALTSAVSQDLGRFEPSLTPVDDEVAAAAEAAVRRAQDAKSSSKPVSCSRRSSDSSAKYVLKDSIEKADNADLMKIFKRKHIERQDSPACRLSELAEKELLRRLEQSEHLYEQFEIIYQLYIDKGLIYDTGWKEKSGSVTLRDLVAELYERAGATKQWWLVRYTAGMLEKAVENLPVCITDLLVRQKQVTIGLPPEPENCLIISPQSSQQLRELIKQASFNDLTLGVLTQEVLVYLSMLARTEPQLFANMYRIRVGLIIRVMGTEIGRSLRLNAEDATEHLLSLSPFEMKTLLHHILSGKEFHAEYVPLSQGGASHITIVSANETELSRSFYGQRGRLGSSGSKSVGPKQTADSHLLDPRRRHPSDPQSASVSGESWLSQSLSSDRQGQWLRRRKIDGALNRVPADFYRRVWRLIECTEGLSINGHVIGQHLTREMTAGEVKFALQVEAAITAVQEPEYRQLLVEALSLLVRLPDLDLHRCIDLRRVLHVEQLVTEANRLFLADQAAHGGDATSCCAGSHDKRLACGGANGVCAHFYDSAPSGRFGTLTYLFRALTDFIGLPSDDVDCAVQ